MTIHPHITLGEVKLKVSNLQQSLHFYREVIGFQILSQTSNTARLTADGENSFLMLEEIPNAVIVPAQSASGLYHFAILLPSRKDLGAILRKFIESGIRIGQADHLVSEALYISDPDNIGIEIYADRPRESWKRDADGNYVMATDPIDRTGLLNEALHETWAGLPSDSTIGHVHFHVGDLDQAKHFYCDILGFEPVADWRRMGAIFVSAGGYHHHIGLNIWAGVGAPATPPNGTGLAYYTIIFPNSAALDKTIERFQTAGSSIRQQDGSWVVDDPFGIRLKMCVK